MTLKSWTIVDKRYGERQMVLIVGDHLSQEGLNRLIQNGMNCVVIDERSNLVNKKYVDKEQ